MCDKLLLVVVPPEGSAVEIPLLSSESQEDEKRAEMLHKLGVG